MTDRGPWRATIEVHRPSASATDRIVQALAPEVSREVPRARAELRPSDTTTVTLALEADDTSSCRAALNTYLSWVGLVLSTERSASGPVGGVGSASRNRSRSA